MAWFLIERPLKPRPEWTVSLQAHYDWMKHQHDEGNVFMSGPSADRKLSIYLVRAASLSVAHGMAAADPMACNGVSAAQVIAWDVHEIMGIGSWAEPAEAGDLGKA